MRTSQEIQDELTALERKIQEDFLKRTPLMHMMTTRQLNQYSKLSMEFIKAGGKL